MRKMYQSSDFNDKIYFPQILAILCAYMDATLLIIKSIIMVPFSQVSLKICCMMTTSVLFKFKLFAASGERALVASW